jgi:GR25 family glycosyltransferase involved in LPS biosynthesis
MEGFPAYVINLKRATRRMARIQQAYTHGRLHRVEAFDGARLAKSTGAYARQVQSGPLRQALRLVSPAEACCTLSHIKAVVAAYDNGEQEALILEDDILPTYAPLADFSLTAIARYRPANAECISLFCVNPAITRRLVSERLPHYVPWSPDVWSSGAYYVTRRGMERIRQRYVLPNGKIDLSACAATQARESFIADCDVLFPQMQTYFFTRPMFIDQCEDSFIHPEHIAESHRPNHILLLKYYRKKTEALRKKPLQ